MALQYDLIFAAVLGVIAFTGSYFTLVAYLAFRGDVLQRLFGFMSASLLLVGGISVVEIAGSVIFPGGLVQELWFPFFVASFALLLAGLVPLVQWADDVMKA